MAVFQGTQTKSQQSLYTPSVETQSASQHWQQGNLAKDLHTPFTSKLCLIMLALMITSSFINIMLSVFIALTYIAFTTYVSWQIWLYTRATCQSQHEQSQAFQEWFYYSLFYHCSFLFILKLLFSLQA